MRVTATEVRMMAQALDMAREAGWVPCTIERAGGVFKWVVHCYLKDVVPTQYSTLLVDTSYSNPCVTEVDDWQPTN